MADPRATNCRAFVKDGGGRVVGIELQYQEKSDTKYQLLSVELIDEVQVGIGGQTVANFSVQDKTGIEKPERVWLAWAWPNITDGHGLPGNQNRQHIITNKFWPPNVGPLSIYVGDANANPISDIIGGLGLPEGHHVSFALTFRERGVVTPPPPPSNGGNEYTDILKDLDRIDAKLDEILKRLATIP